MPTSKRVSAHATSRNTVNSASEPNAKVAVDSAKRLIIAEKPSVAVDIARALGGLARHGDFFEGDGYLVCSAIGHLLELSAPAEYEVKRGKWSFAHLPVIPPHFDLRPIEKTEERLKLIKKLIKRKDVVGLINGCDAGREGELIFRYIVQSSGTRKPIERLWLQSMTPAAIREGFARLRTDESMKALADAAACRSESDWLIGINGTRAMTAFNSKDGGFYKTTVGRVQTPTLSILVEREIRIKEFRPRQFWEVHGVFQATEGEYVGKWFDEQFEKSTRADDVELKPERIWEPAVADQLARKCLGKPGIVTEDTKPSSQIPPLLYDLTSLQREANSRFGFSAKTTLGIAQALYEKHKVLTYPRTDSRALPEDYLDTVKTTLETFSGRGDKNSRTRNSGSLEIIGRYAGFAERILAERWVRPNKRVFNNEKVSDHFAIIPTLETPKNLSELESKLYDLVFKRFLAVFYPSAEYLLTTRITRVSGEPFRTEGKILVSPGWLEVYGKESQSDSDSLLAQTTDGKSFALDMTVMALQTRAPVRFNEATLLSAMEGAGKLVEDEELRTAMNEKGLGTPATRASIIEGLIYEEYVVREGRELVPTAKAFDLTYVLWKLGIDELRSPELTGTWEHKLKQMEQGKLQRQAFMEHIVETTQDLVNRVKQGTFSDEPISVLASKCPRCGSKVFENYRKFQCSSCEFSIWKVVAGRRLEAHELEQLVSEGSLGPLQGFRSKAGRPFSAMLRLKNDLSLEFDFGPKAENETEQGPVDFSGQQALGSCPKCSASVFDYGMAYVCENSVGSNKSCDFRSGKVILNRPIESEQMRKLLENGRTELLHRFISKKGRPFSAYLVKNSEGRVGFEFAPRTQAKAPKKSVKAETTVVLETKKPT
jgi:DNA topoisomerase-3